MGNEQGGTLPGDGALITPTNLPHDRLFRRRARFSRGESTHDYGVVTYYCHRLIEAQPRMFDSE